jgi:hypothetical protein
VDMKGGLEEAEWERPNARTELFSGTDSTTYCNTWSCSWNGKPFTQHTSIPDSVLP